MRHITRSSAALAVALALTTPALTPGQARAEAPPAASYDQPYRPQFHYSPARNWVNDPNGLVYYKGEYHLFYQHNPLGNDWGNMSWGHAVSKDLVHWTELPVAIPFTPDEGVFSGSVVIDEQNTSGLGKPGRPAMVAIYTSARNGNQSQALAYSLDAGRTFTRYEGNPVLDIGSGEFRDPKVFWHAAQKKWVMVVAKSTEHKIAIYSSKNLREWNHESDFGPLNATGGVWECPDLFPLPTGRGKQQKWVMIVNLNPGGPQGGSAAQYFVGDFDGTTFTPDDKLYAAPTGAALAHFDAATYQGWTTIGDAFGTAPAQGNLEGQAGVTGWIGEGFVNSFHNRDAGTGTLTSPAFTVNSSYINFLVGGGNHPRLEGAVPGGKQPAGTVLADFEEPGWPAGWTATGDLAGLAPAAGTIGDQQQVSGYLGRQLVNTFLDHDRTTGTLTSPPFAVTTKNLALLVGGGNHPMDSANPTAVNLVVDGKVVRTATGADSEALNWVNWDLSDLQGKQAQVQVVDQNSSGWGHILVDQIVAGDEPALPMATDTSVNLVVDGTVVRSTTGANSEALDWRSWDVSQFRGKQARIEVVDNNTGGYGHILADQFTASSAPALSSIERSHWLDEGADHYAAVTFNNAPAGRRISIAWMNNWQYVGATPTDPWRSAFTFPRELSLVREGRSWAVRSEPVRELARLERRRPAQVRNIQVKGEQALPLHGTSYDLTVQLDLRRADRAGIDVRVGNGQYTRIGVDATTNELYIDRTNSGAVGFHAAFPAEHRAKLAVRNGKVTLRVLVDRSSVEVFAEDGRLVMTDLVYPDLGSDGVRAFSEGGRAVVRSASLQPVQSIWKQR